MKYLFLIAILLTTSCTLVLAKEDKFREWQEEVQLNDGRVIVVNQKWRCDGNAVSNPEKVCVLREVLLTFNLPEYSKADIVWNEHLKPMVLNVNNGSLYVVGRPPTLREFEMYGKPRPPYIGFIFNQKQWHQIPFNDIPKEIYDANLLIESPSLTNDNHISLSEKMKRNSDVTLGKSAKCINPNYKSNFEQ